MSRWHRVNPEKGNQVEPPAPGIGKPQEDALRWPTLCEKHPDEHAKARDAVYRDQQAHGLSASNAMAISRAISCPACYLNNVNKAYDRKARLAENAEEMVRIIAEMTGAAEVDGMDERSNVWRSLLNDANALLQRIEGDQ